MSADSFEKAQRVRLRFARAAQAAMIGHLDLTRAWERAFAAGGVPVSYSPSRKRQARITIAPGLPSGVTSEGELMDVVLSARMPVEDVRARVSAHLPEGLRCCDVTEVGIGLPSLAASVRWADYQVELPPDPSRNPLDVEIDAFLGLEALPWEDTRREKVRRYDLRALVGDLRLERGSPSTRLFMRLRCDPAGVGRPEQVLKALDLPDATSIHRLRLVLESPSPARDAWRRRGRFL